MSLIFDRIARSSRSLSLVLSFLVLSTTPVRAQFVGYGYGIPAYGYAFPAYGYGYPAFASYGYPGFGYGFYGSGFFYTGPAVNAGFGGLGYGYGYPNPYFGVGLTPLGVNS